MLKITINVSGDKKVIKQIRKIESEFRTWRPELKKVGDFLKDFYSNAVFETEGGVFGSRWSPLSPRYELWKRKNFAGRGILERSGAMRRGFIADVGNTSLQIKNDVFYSRYHQKGEGVPKRVMAQLDRKRQKEVVDVFKKGVITRLKKIKQ